MEEKEWDVSDTAYPKRKRCKGCGHRRPISANKKEYKKKLTNIYGSWSTAATYGRKYKERMKKKEREKNK